MQSGKFATPRPNSTAGIVIQVFAANTEPNVRAKAPKYMSDVLLSVVFVFGVITRSKGDRFDSDFRLVKGYLTLVFVRET
jgi:hypothetical protein